MPIRNRYKPTHRLCAVYTEGKKRFQHRLINAMRVVRFFKGHAMRQFTKKALIARHHYHGYLKRKILKIFKKFTTLSQSDLLMRMRYLNPKLHRNMLLRTFSHLRDQEAVILDQKLQNGADVLWEYHAKQKIIKNWKSANKKSTNWAFLKSYSTSFPSCILS